MLSRDILTASGNSSDTFFDQVMIYQRIKRWLIISTTSTANNLKDNPEQHYPQHYTAIS